MCSSQLISIVSNSISFIIRLEGPKSDFHGTSHAIVPYYFYYVKVDKKGRNFLHVAIQKCDMESVMFLLSVEVDVNSRVQDATLAPPLHLAAAAGNEVLLRSLLLAGARPNDRDAHK